jgi:hypothetical protein
MSVTGPYAVKELVAETRSAFFVYQFFDRPPDVRGAHAAYIGRSKLP